MQLTWMPLMTGWSFTRYVQNFPKLNFNSIFRICTQMLMPASVKCIGINSVLCSRKTSRLMWLDRAAQRLSRMKRVRDCLEVRYCVFSSQLSLLELLFQEIKESEQFWAMQLKSLPFYLEPLFPSIPREIEMTDPVQRDVPGHVPAPALLPRTERPIVTTRA